MGRKGRGKGPLEKDGGYAQPRGSQAFGEDGGYAQPRGSQAFGEDPIPAIPPGTQIWPMTPLGVPAEAPPIPPLPPCLMLPSAPVFPASAGHAAGGLGAGAGGGFDNGLFGGIAGPAVPPLPYCVLGGPPAEAQNELQQRSAAKQDGNWDFETRADRRTFFHTEGKSQTFKAVHNGRNASSEMYDHGSNITLEVEEIHFGNPRVGILSANPAPMPEMLRWQPSEFAKHTLECAQIMFGDYWVWCAVGIPSNRLLYAAKRANLSQINVVVVPPPRVAKGSEEEIDLTYGASIQGIQLVPK